MDPDGQVYYHNTKTGESVWDPPDPLPAGCGGPYSHRKVDLKA